MNQLPPVPAIGLTLAVPKERVEQAIDEMVLRGRSLLQRKADSREMMDQLKRQNWDWVVHTSNALK
jgi:polyhydroxyalkanoate synthesis regulator phasin